MLARTICVAMVLVACGGTSSAEPTQPLGFDFPRLDSDNVGECWKKLLAVPCLEQVNMRMGWGT